MDALVGRLTTFELDNYDNYVSNSKNIEFALKPNSHSRKIARNKKPINQEVRKKLKKVLRVILKLLKPYLQRNIPKAKKSTKVKSLYSTFLVKKLVILLLGVQIEKARM